MQELVVTPALSYAKALELLQENPQQLAGRLVYFPLQFSEQDRFQQLQQAQQLKQHGAQLKLASLTEEIEASDEFSFELSLRVLAACPQRLRGKTVRWAEEYTLKEALPYVLALRRAGAHVNLVKLAESTPSTPSPEKLVERIEIPEELCCFLTKKLMSEPVILISSGETYEKEALEAWLQHHNTDPATQEELEDKKFKVNNSTKRTITRLLEKHPSLSNSPLRYHSARSGQQLGDALARGDLESLNRLHQQHPELLANQQQHATYFKHASACDNPASIEWLAQVLGGDLLALDCLDDGGTQYMEEQATQKSALWVRRVAKILGFSGQESQSLTEQALEQTNQQLGDLKNKLLDTEQELLQVRKSDEESKQQIQRLTEQNQELVNRSEQKDQEQHQLKNTLMDTEQELTRAKKSAEQLTEKIQDLIQENQRLHDKLERSKQKKPKALKLKFFRDLQPNDLKRKVEFKDAAEAVDYFSNEAYQIGKFNHTDVNELLILVSEGNIEATQQRLAQCPLLALAQGDLVDLAGRKFCNITAFQYAVWSLDGVLWSRMLEQQPTELTAKHAALQYNALKHHRPDITNVHGCHYRFEPLLKAYQDLEDNWSQWDWQQRSNHFVKVIGGEQRNVPAWYIFAFCEEGTEVAWPKQEILTRLEQVTRGKGTGAEIRDFLKTGLGGTHGLRRLCGGQYSSEYQFNYRENFFFTRQSIDHKNSGGCKSKAEEQLKTLESSLAQELGSQPTRGGKVTLN